MLAVKGLVGVAREMNLRNTAQARKCASKKSTLTLKPRADVTRSPKQGCQGPHKRHMSINLFLKKSLSNLKSNQETYLAWNNGSSFSQIDVDLYLNHHYSNGYINLKFWNLIFSLIRFWRLAVTFINHLKIHTLFVAWFWIMGSVKNSHFQILHQNICQQLTYGKCYLWACS